MNAYYLYTIKLNDLISPSLKKAMVSSNAFSNKFNQNTNKFTNNTKRLPNNIDGLNQKLLWLQNRRDKAFDIKKIRLNQWSDFWGVLQSSYNKCCASYKKNTFA